MKIKLYKNRLIGGLLCFALMLSLCAPIHVSSRTVEGIFDSRGEVIPGSLVGMKLEDAELLLLDAGYALIVM